MNLHIIMLKTESGETPSIVFFIDDNSSLCIGNGMPVVRETGNCWYIDDPPKGLPVRYRKAEEYRLITNHFGVYMFGSDAYELITAWNRALCVQGVRHDR